MKNTALYTTLIALSSMLVFACTPPTTRESVTEEITARVLTKGEIESFDLGGALIGYMIGESMCCGGGLYGGFIGGVAAADDCEVPVMVEGEALTLSAPDRACRDSEENQIVTVNKTTTTVRDRETGEVKSTRIRYRWKR